MFSPDPQEHAPESIAMAERWRLVGERLSEDPELFAQAVLMLSIVVLKLSEQEPEFIT
jgi:hypothetical protein